MKRMILFSVCFFPYFSLSAGPLNKAQVDADAKWLLHLDLEAFKKSSFGTLAISEIQSRYGDQIAALEELFGSNPLKDLNQITLYGPDSNDKNAILIVQGRFNPEKLLALPALNSAYVKTFYRNYTIHEWTDPDHGKNQVGVFARGDLIILSQTRRPVEQTLDILDGKRPSLAQSNGLSFIDKTATRPIVLLVAEDLGRLTEGNIHAAILKNSQTMAIAAKEDNQTVSVDLDLGTQDVHAAQIEQAFVGMKAFAMLNQKNQPLLARLGESLQIQTEDMLVSIRFRCPSQTLFSILKEFQIQTTMNIQPNPHPKESGGNLSSAD